MDRPQRINNMQRVMHINRAAMSFGFQNFMLVRCYVSLKMTKNKCLQPRARTRIVDLLRKRVGGWRVI